MSSLQNFFGWHDTEHILSDTSYGRKNLNQMKQYPSHFKRISSIPKNGPLSENHFTFLNVHLLKVRSDGSGSFDEVIIQITLLLSTLYTNWFLPGSYPLWSLGLHKGSNHISSPDFRIREYPRGRSTRIRPVLFHRMNNTTNYLNFVLSLLHPVKERYCLERVSPFTCRPLR